MSFLTLRHPPKARTPTRPTHEAERKNKQSNRKRASGSVARARFYSPEKKKGLTVTGAGRRRAVAGRIAFLRFFSVSCRFASLLPRSFPSKHEHGPAPPLARARRRVACARAATTGEFAWQLFHGRGRQAEPRQVRQHRAIGHCIARAVRCRRARAGAAVAVYLTATLLPCAGCCAD